MSSDMTPIKFQGQDMQGQDMSEEEIEEETLSQTVRSNQKHFSNNQRLLDSNTVEVLKKCSPRLPATNEGNTADTSSRKTKKSTTGTCTDGREKAKSARTSSRNDPHETTDTTSVASGRTSAFERYELYKAQREEDLAAGAGPSGKQDTPPKISTKKTTPTKYNTKTTVVAAAAGSRNTSRSSGRSRSPSQGDTIYDLTIDPNSDYADFQSKSAPGHRRVKEEANKKKKAQDIDIASALREKNVAINRMTDTFSNLHGAQTTTAASANNPDQLWADALVPHLGRMKQETKDCFMFHVLGLAFKAIQGVWPKGEN